jgi:protein-S-isoprenylcysteine O-methyltransferase Ste14
VEQSIFKTIYLTGFIIIFGIRLFYRWRARTNRIEVSRKNILEILLLAQAAVGIAAIPLVYVFTSRLDFADYRLPAWAGWIGAAIFAPAVFLLWRSHADLGRNWSQTLELREGHRLVTRGVYEYVRHPMYAAFFLWGFAQPLLLHNWIAGWSHLASFSLLYFFRVRREERMMLDEFGEKYQAYMNKTGRIVPRLLR